MNVIRPQPKMTETEFLDWVVQQDARYEFDGTGPVPMAGNTLAHLLIQANLVRWLGTILRNTAFWAGGSDSFARVPGRLRLPDVVVLPDGTDFSIRVIENAVVVFEILSADSGKRDRLEKASEYWSVPSIRHYVIIEQTVRAATVLSRGDTAWTRQAVRGRGSIELDRIGVTIPLDEVYDRLPLRSPDEAPRPALP